jgi:predicted tellurium resistance membrane protein TerC
LLVTLAEGAHAVTVGPIFSIEHLFTVHNLLALLTLSALEIVLGIDNIVFISILTGKLPEHLRGRARRTGLFVAMFARIALLLSITWIMGLTKPLFTVPALGDLLNEEAREFTGKDTILLLGGVFLVFKATKEIHHKLDGHESAAGTHPDPARKLVKASLGVIVAQIIVIDIVFSLDSVITAVGMAQDIRVMILAVVIAVGVMMAVSGVISRFVERHPTIKMLALSFLLLIGVLLVAGAFGKEVPKGYVYFAMAFSLGVEMLNIRMRRNTGGVHRRGAEAQRNEHGKTEE